MPAWQDESLQKLRLHVSFSKSLVNLRNKNSHCLEWVFISHWICSQGTSSNNMSCKCMFLGSLSHHNKDLEWRTLKPPQRVTALRSRIDCVIALRSRMDHVIALRQISVTALFYLEDSRKIHLRGVRACRSKDSRRRVPQHGRERERERARFGSSFYMFLSPWACPM